MILEHRVGHAERDLDPARGMARLRQVALPNLDGRVVVVLQLQGLGHEQPSGNECRTVLLDRARTSE